MVYRNTLGKGGLAFYKNTRSKGPLRGLTSEVPKFRPFLFKKDCFLELCSSYCSGYICCVLHAHCTMYIALIGDSPMGSSDYIMLCFLSYVFVYYVFCVSFVEFIMCLCILCFVYYVFCLMCFECLVWGAVMRKPLALFASSTGNLPQNVQTQRCNYFLLFHNLK